MERLSQLSGEFNTREDGVGVSMSCEEVMQLGNVDEIASGFEDLTILQTTYTTEIYRTLS